MPIARNKRGARRGREWAWGHVEDAWDVWAGREGRERPSSAGHEHGARRGSPSSSGDLALSTLASTFALFLVTTPTCHGAWTIRCIRVPLFHLASPFNREPLSLCTPSARSCIVLLSMLVSDLPPRSCLARIAYPPRSLDQGPSE